MDKLVAQNLVKSKKVSRRDLEAHRGAEGRTQWRDYEEKKRDYKKRRDCDEKRREKMSLESKI